MAGVMLLDILAETIVLPAMDCWRGSKASHFRTEVQSVLSANAMQVSEYQLSRIRAICSHAYEHTQFYRRRFDQVGIRSFDKLNLEDFQRIPPLTKTDIREHVDSLLSQIHSPVDRRQSATGGTTNSPTTIYMDWPAYDRRWAATYEWNRRIGCRRGRKVAYLWGARQDFNPTPSWKERILNCFGPREKFLASSPLDEETMAKYHEVLEQWGPSYLQAYPTPLAIFADFLNRNRLRLRVPGISVTAEPMLRSQVEVITEAFGRRPYNWYGARESGRIATECQFHSGMHVNVYGVYVEIDTQNNSFGAGMGRLLITDLWNCAMPMIRYDIGDIGTLTSEPCRCGSALPRINSLEGRTTDVFINSAGQRIPGVAFTNRIVKDDSKIREMQLIQTAIQKFEILVVPGVSWQGAITVTELRGSLNEFMQESTEAEVKIVDCIPRESSGKVKFCKNMLKC